MPPKRPARTQRSPSFDNEITQNILGGAAVKTKLPPIPSRFSTAYGSPIAAAPVRRRLRPNRNLRDIVNDILQRPDDDDDSDEGPNLGGKNRLPPSRPPPRSPRRGPQPEPDPAPEPESDPAPPPSNGSSDDELNQNELTLQPEDPMTGGENEPSNNDDDDDDDDDNGGDESGSVAGSGNGQEIAAENEAGDNSDRASEGSNSSKRVREVDPDPKKDPDPRPTKKRRASPSQSPDVLTEPEPFPAPRIELETPAMRGEEEQETERSPRRTPKQPHRHSPLHAPPKAPTPRNPPPMHREEVAPRRMGLRSAGMTTGATPGSAVTIRSFGDESSMFGAAGLERTSGQTPFTGSTPVRSNNNPFANLPHHHGSSPGEAATITPTRLEATPSQQASPSQRPPRSVEPVPQRTPAARLPAPRRPDLPPMHTTRSTVRAPVNPPDDEPSPTSSEESEPKRPSKPADEPQRPRRRTASPESRGPSRPRNEGRELSSLFSSKGLNPALNPRQGQSSQPGQPRTSTSNIPSGGMRSQPHQAPRAPSRSNVRHPALARRLDAGARRPDDLPPVQGLLRQSRPRGSWKNSFSWLALKAKTASGGGGDEDPDGTNGGPAQHDKASWLRRVLSSIISMLSWLFASWTGILLLAILGFLTTTWCFSPDNSLTHDDVFADSATEARPWPLQWYGWSSLSYNLGQFLPLALARPTTIFSSKDAANYEHKLRNSEYALKQLKDVSGYHDESLAKLNTILPKILHMELDKQGKPRINDEFYHGLRDLMLHDRQILTMERGEHGYLHISDQHWNAIKLRLNKEDHYSGSTAAPPAAPSLPGLSRAEISYMIDSKVPPAWEDWVKKNRDKVAGILAPVLPTPSAVGNSLPDELSEQMIKKFEALALDRIRQNDAGLGSVVVTRKEFLGHIEEEFSKHRAQIAAQAEGILRHNVTAYVRELVQAARLGTSASDVSRGEIIQLVDKQVREVLSNAGISALANSKINSGWELDLRNRVNFFARGAGAIIDPLHTSPTFQPTFEGFQGTFLSKQYEETFRRRKGEPPTAALDRWDETGECWCGSTIKNRVMTSGRRTVAELPEGVSLSVLMGYSVVPEYVVVEHILPERTPDPRAAPKDLEVWTYIEDLALRNRAEDVSMTHFGDSTSWSVARQRHAYGDGWVKIGQFMYEANPNQEGVYVYQVPVAFRDMGLLTDHVILRATSNLGSEDHTCFYRIRMYGRRAGSP